MSDHGFWTAPDGVRYYGRTPGTRPHAVPDEEAEHRLTAANRRFAVAGFLWTMLSAFLVMRLHEAGVEPLASLPKHLLAFVVSVLGSLALRQLIVGRQLESLERGHIEITLHDHASRLADRYDVSELVFRILVGLGFAALGVWFFKASPILACLMIVVFLWFSVAHWGLAAYLKVAADRERRSEVAAVD